MKHIWITLILVTAIISCNTNNASEHKTGEHKGLVVASDSAGVKYQCPMQCEGDTAYTTPGQCPVCEMDLEKVESKTRTSNPKP